MSKQPFIFYRQGSSLVPAEPWTAERLDQYPEGKQLKAATLTQSRSVAFQGFYWVHLAEICRATECAATADHLHKSLLKLCGYWHQTTDIKGNVIDIAVDSTRFEKMDQPEFFEYVEQAKKVLATELGIVWDDYTLTLEEIEEKRKARNNA